MRISSLVFVGLLAVFSAIAAVGLVQASPLVAALLLASMVGLLILTITRLMPSSKNNDIDPKIPALSISLALAFAALDPISGGFVSDGPPWRYAILLPAFTVTIAMDARDALLRTRDSEKVISVLLMLSPLVYLSGAAAFTLLRSSFSLSNVAFVGPPLAVLGGLALAVFLGRKPMMTDRHRERLFLAGATIYSGTALIDVIQNFGRQPLFANHERVFVLLFIICFVSKRHWWLQLAICLAFVIGQYDYPSATAFLVVIAAAAVISAWPSKRRPSGFLLLAIVAGAGVGYQLFGPRLLGSFYARFQRGSNEATRRDLWRVAEDRLNDRPLFGNALSEPPTAPANIRGSTAQVPFHNDLLTMGVLGGYILLLLSAIAVLAISWHLIRRGGRAARSIVIIVAAIVVTMSFNPILQQLGSALPLYAILFWSAVIALSDARASEESDLLERRCTTPDLMRASNEIRV